jgi:hypothetical protein
MATKTEDRVLGFLAAYKDVRLYPLYDRAVTRALASPPTRPQRLDCLYLHLLSISIPQLVGSPPLRPPCATIPIPIPSPESRVGVPWPAWHHVVAVYSLQPTVEVSIQSTARL